MFRAELLTLKSCHPLVQENVDGYKTTGEVWLALQASQNVKTGDLRFHLKGKRDAISRTLYVAEVHGPRHDSTSSEQGLGVRLRSLVESAWSAASTGTYCCQLRDAGSKFGGFM